MEKKKIVIAIDGPASAGKTTTAKLVAQHLRCMYVDSGVMYRAVALYLLNNKIDWCDPEKLKSVLEKIKLDIRYDPSKNGNRVFLNGKDVTDSLRASEVSQLSSTIATQKVVREKLVELQREIGKKHSIVMDGRDIGTVVFPDADFKFFLTASLEERAKRRWKEMKERYGESVPLEKVKEEIKVRDEKDSTREIAPLRKAEDAIVIDTTNLSIEEQARRVIEILLSFTMSPCHVDRQA
jgi:cytidylate kinase